MEIWDFVRNSFQSDAAMLMSAVRIIFVVILAYIFVKVIRRMLRKLESTLISRGIESGMTGETTKRAETLTRLIRQGVVIATWVVALLVVFRELGIDIGPILASAGVVGLAVGFGAQNLVRDIISGFFMILEDQIRVGDVAIVNGTGGLVEKINFRTTVLRDLSGTVHIIPNGTINTMANMTREWSAYVFDIGVAYKEDVNQVMDILRQIGAELRQDANFGTFIVDDVEVFGVDKFADSAVVIKGRLRTVPIKQWDVGREFLRRVKMRFDQEGIEIPFPHRSIYFGKPQDDALNRLLNQE